MTMPEIWCQFCKPNQPRFAKYLLRYVGPGPAGSGTLKACGRHLTRGIEFLTNPGGRVELEVLE